MMFPEDFPEGAGPLNFLHKTIARVAGGFITGGPLGAASALVRGGGGGGRPSKPGRQVAFVEIHPSGARHTHFVDDPQRRLSVTSASRGFAPIASTGPGCPPFMKKDPVTGECGFFLGTMRGRDLSTEELLRGDLLDAGGEPTVGGFGLPALTPAVFTRLMRNCGPGLVLGRDNLCYPKSVLQRRSRNRKWRGAPRPVFSAADGKIIRKAEHLRDNVKDLNKAVGLRIPTKRVKAT